MNTETIRLWQLISQALPVGGFHYSQGLEQAVECGWISDEASAGEWINGLLRHNLAHVDLPILKRIQAAWSWGDEGQVRHWDQVSRACRETAELRDEEQQMGLALSRLARSMDEPLPATDLGFVAIFGIMAANNGIEPEDTLTGYAWSWCENQVLSAVKLVPLGHLAGQRLLRCLGDQLIDVVAGAMDCVDENVGMTAHGLVLASARHETQYTRLFRS